MNKSGGLYNKVEMSLKTANFIVIVAILALVCCFCFAVNNTETADPGYNETSTAVYIREESN